LTLDLVNCKCRILQNAYYQLNELRGVKILTAEGKVAIPAREFVRIPTKKGWFMQTFRGGKKLCQKYDFKQAKKIKKPLKIC
jgi:hypothetical protein